MAIETETGRVNYLIRYRAEGEYIHITVRFMDNSYIDTKLRKEMFNTLLGFLTRLGKQDQMVLEGDIPVGVE